jgi:transcriptional regulator with XRE-family HTH domain
MSSIDKHSTGARRLSATLDPAVRRALGDELRRRRLEQGLSQASVGAPLTRAYVSAVERGLVVPSLPALRLMAERLEVPLSELFRAVEDSMFSRT